MESISIKNDIMAIIRITKTGTTKTGVHYVIARVRSIDKKKEIVYHSVIGFGFNGVLLERNGSGKVLQMTTRFVDAEKPEVITFAREVSKDRIATSLFS